MLLSKVKVPGDKADTMWLVEAKLSVNGFGKLLMIVDMLTIPACFGNGSIGSEAQTD